MAEKIVTGRPAYTVTDYLGGRIAVENQAALQKILDLLDSRYRILESDNKIANPQRGGYRAVHLQVDLGNGMSAEVQIVPSRIAEVMDSTHALYDKYKRLDKDTMSAEQKIAYDADMKKIKSIHDAAWDEQERRGWHIFKSE